MIVFGENQIILIHFPFNLNLCNIHCGLDWSSHPIYMYRDRYRLMKTVQMTVRFHKTSIKFAIFSKFI